MSAPWLRNNAASSSSSQNTTNVWSEHVANDNRTYYWNSETKTSSWEKPDVLKTPEERAAQDVKNGTVPERAEDWKEYETADGSKYYHNANTGLTTWDKPEALIRAEERSNALRQEQSDKLNGSLNRFEDDDLEVEMQELERTDRINMVGKDGKAISAADYARSDDAIPVFKTPELAEEAFIKMLKRTGAQIDWTWSQAMKAAIREPVWRSLPDTASRKAAFERYLVELKKATIGKQKDRIEKLRRDFDLMLRRHDEIKAYSQWRNVKMNLEGEVAYKAAIDDEEREALFHIYTEQLQERETKEKRQRMQDAIVIFTKSLSELDITLGTRWADVQAQIKSSDLITQNPKLQELRRIDMLLAYEDHIKDVERTHVSKLRKERVLRKRKQRKNREAFNTLLQEMRVEGVVYAGINWQTVYNLVKDRPEYLALLHQNGSSPLEYFWDLSEELEKELRDRRAMVLDVLNDKNVSITVDTSFTDFLEIMQSDNRSSHMIEHTLKIIYKQLIETAQKKVDDERRIEERRTRRKQDDLRSAMKKLDPPIRVTDTYESARIRISMLAEFTALESEEARRGAFSKYIRRLKERLEEEEERAARRERHSHRSPREKRHDRERRSSRDSRRSGGHERDEHDSRRHHRGERRSSLDYDPRSPKRLKKEGNGVEDDSRTADVSGSIHEDTSFKASATNVIEHEMVLGSVETRIKDGDEESEEGEIAE